ncbi:hypothetical protein ZOSMA_27G00620 [Zostera marina]|uniref:DUF4408 domain-containing protein n=1 Tax=Zostera marina TaxID=29655 RepID=A0A0K9PFL5_ZOSMR|nr:hypothetical protein ZOSMA_27G00620 [Zostera marina]
MDNMSMEKFQAMKGYKRRKKTFLYRLIHYIRTTVFFGLFLSSPIWLPKLKSSFKYVIFVALPTFYVAVFAPKCLFFICNIIIVFLLNQSKRSTSTSFKQDVYDEYVQKSKVLRKTDDQCMSTPLEEEEEKEEKEEEEEEEEEEEKVVVESCRFAMLSEEKDGELLEGESSSGEDEEEESEAIPADELHRRANDFIARVNEQRRAEARMFGTT